MRISDWSSDVCSSDLKPSAGAMVAEIQKNAGKALAITVLRDKAPVTLTVTPTEHTQADGSVIGRIGVVLGADFPMVDVRYGLLDSVTRGLTRTAAPGWFSLKLMGRMGTGDVLLRNVSGLVRKSVVWGRGVWKRVRT